MPIPKYSDSDFCNCGSGKYKEIGGGFVCTECHKALACNYEFEDINRKKHPANKFHFPLSVPICHLHESAADEYYRGFFQDYDDD